MSQRIHKMPGVLPTHRSAQASPKPRRWPFILVILIMVASGVYWALFKGPVFAIEAVEVTGSDNPAIRSITNRLVGSNIFRLSTPGIEQEIRQVHPPVESVTLVRGLPRTLRVAITLRTPKLRWQTNNAVYILDSQGQAFEEGDKEPYQALPKVVDHSNLPVTVNQYVVTPSFMAFIYDLQTLGPQTTGKSFVAYEVRDTTFHIDSILDSGTRIRLTTQRPAKEQLEGAQAILVAHANAKHIDVRVPGRGYYKEQL